MLGVLGDWQAFSREVADGIELFAEDRNRMPSAGPDQHHQLEPLRSYNRSLRTRLTSITEPTFEICRRRPRVCDRQRFNRPVPGKFQRADDAGATAHWDTYAQ